MNKLVTLEFDGSFETNFTVTLSIGDGKATPELKIKGKLPRNTSLLKKIKDWREHYLEETKNKRAKFSKPNPYAHKAPSFVSEDFLECFHNWLLSEDFKEIQEQCQTNLQLDSEIRFLIQTDCNELQELPWHKWNLIENLENAEVGIALPNSQNREVNEISNQYKKIKILAILGDRDGINIEEDRKILENINAADAEVTFLNQSKRKEISDRLWEEPWDIIFFAGHSETDSNKGILHIFTDSLISNNTSNIPIIWLLLREISCIAAIVFLRKFSPDQLDLAQLKNGLKKAIDRGLQLAIFNSCDGFGLARELQRLNIPQVIVMKEEVEDKVAHNFIEYFFDNFSKQNKSLYQSVREARNRLEDELEPECPYASWLPIIWQNSLATPKTWKDLKNTKEKKLKSDITIISLLLILIIIVIRELGTGLFFPLEFIEIPFYDLMMRTRALSPELQDDRIVAITIDDKDLEYQDRNGLERESYQDEYGKTHKVSLSDNAFAELLKKITPHQPDVIGLDILRPDPANNNYLQNQLQTNQDIFMICEGKAYEDEFGEASPPELKNARERVGFSDVVLDFDDTVRRYFTFGRFLEDSPCLPYQNQGNIKYDAPSFSFLVAQHYLNKRGKGFKEEQILQLLNESASLKQGEAYFNKWSNNLGGPYRSESNDLEKRAGLQIPLNYRYVENDEIAANFSLRDILHNYPDLFDRNPSLIKNKIVLIGVTAKSKEKEYFLTPFSRQEKIAGVYLHAQAISQIISAVENARPFLAVLTRWQESIWIIFSGGTGIILIWYYKTLKTLILRTIFATVILLTIHIISFINGLWIPVIPALVIVVPPLGVLSSKGKGVFHKSAIIKQNK